MIWACIIILTALAAMQALQPIRFDVDLNLENANIQAIEMRQGD